MADISSFENAPARFAKRSANPGRRYLKPVPLAFAATIFANFLLEMHGTDTIGQIGSFTLHGADIAALMTVIAIMTSRPGRPRLDIISILVLAIGALITFSLFRGALDNAFYAFFALRIRIVALLFLFYVALIRRNPEPLASSQPWFAVLVAAYSGLCVLRLIYGPTLFLDHNSFAYVNVVNLEFRPLDAETVLMLGFALIFYLDLSLDRKSAKDRPFYLFVLIVAFAAIAASRQRTSGLAVLVGIAVFFMSDIRFLRRHKVVVIILGSLFALTIVIWSTGMTQVLLSMLPTEFQVSLQKTATLEARLAVWTFALGVRFPSWGTLSQLFGSPAGEPLKIFFKGLLWPYTLHSQYVATVMNYGVVGVIVWGTLVVTAIVRAVRALKSNQPNRVGLQPRVVLAWFAMLLIFGISYEWRDDAAFFLAMVLVGWPHIPTRRKGRGIIGRVRRPLPVLVAASGE